MSLRSVLLAFALSVPLVMLPAPARAAETGGVVFADTLRLGEAELALRGTALLRWSLIFRVYVAAFYLPPEVPGARWQEDVPKRLEIHYLVDIPGEKFGPASEPYLATNVPAGELERLRPRIERLAAAYRDIRKGDRYALTYLPGRGTELAWNGEPLIVIAGEDFARWYYTIWLGEKPIDAAMRDALLGRARGETR